MVSNAVTAGDDEGLVVAGTKEGGAAWAKLVWLAEWMSQELKVDTGVSGSSLGPSAGLSLAAFSAKDTSSKEDATNSARQGSLATPLRVHATSSTSRMHSLPRLEG